MTPKFPDFHGMTDIVDSQCPLQTSFGINVEMRDSASTVLDRIQRGKDSYLELKEVVFSGGKITGPDRRMIADELAAFANFRGGHLILGVRDGARDIIGIPSNRIDLVEDFVVDIVSQSIFPPLEVTTEHIFLPDTAGVERLVIQIFVPRSLDVHRSPSGYLRRIGSSKRQLPQPELGRLIMERQRMGHFGFDEETVHTAYVRDLSPELIKRFETERTDDDLATFAVKLGFVRRTQEGDLRPTVAGILLCATEPQQWFSQAYVQAVAYRGKGYSDSANLVNYQIDARDVTGPVDVQITEACRFVAKSQGVSASKTLGRSDRPQYDMTAIFESIVNAVAHRDYSIHGSKIRLHMFSDRLELYSPGGLPNTLELDALPYRQFSRNPVIASRLADISVPRTVPGLETSRSTMMDRRGEGVRTLLQRSESHSGKRPTYRVLDESEVQLTIFAAE